MLYVCIASKGISGEITDESKKISSTFGSGITYGDFSNKELLKATSEVFGMYICSYVP